VFCTHTNVVYERLFSISFSYLISDGLFIAAESNTPVYWIIHINKRVYTTGLVDSTRRAETNDTLCEFKFGCASYYGNRHVHFISRMPRLGRIVSHQFTHTHTHVHATYYVFTRIVYHGTEFVFRSSSLAIRNDTLLAVSSSKTILPYQNPSIDPSQMLSAFVRIYEHTYHLSTPFVIGLVLLLCFQILYICKLKISEILNCPYLFLSLRTVSVVRITIKSTGCVVTIVYLAV